MGWIERALYCSDGWKLRCFIDDESHSFPSRLNLIIFYILDECNAGFELLGDDCIGKKTAVMTAHHSSARCVILCLVDFHGVKLAFNHHQQEETSKDVLIYTPFIYTFTGCCHFHWHDIQGVQHVSVIVLLGTLMSVMNVYSSNTVPYLPKVQVFRRSILKYLSFL